jgi:hypothetical protein
MAHQALGRVACGPEGHGMTLLSHRLKLSLRFWSLGEAKTTDQLLLLRE